MKKNYLAIAAAICILIIYTVFFPKNSINTSNKPRSIKNKVSISIKKEDVIARDARPFKDPKDLVKEGTWKKASEPRGLPKFEKVKGLWIRVSLKGNRTYIMSGDKPIYTMLSTGGKYQKGKSYTPTGTFRIEEERGKSFFNPKLNEGARNFVSWKEHGIYLFHSVPTKANKKINYDEASILGKSQGSHGCIRLSLPDSDYLSSNIPLDTKVVIKDK